MAMYTGLGRPVDPDVKLTKPGHAKNGTFGSDVEGVRGPDGSVITELDRPAAERLIADGTISGGMIPKVENCLHAASLGVPAQVVDGRKAGALLAREGNGTIVVPATG